MDNKTQNFQNISEFICRQKEQIVYGLGVRKTITVNGFEHS